MDIGAIQGALTSLKTAADILKAMAGLKITTEVQSNIIELQSVILEAQGNAIEATTAQYQLIERIRALEADLASRDNWGNESQRYALVAMWGGAAQAYALKQAAANGESPHLLCPQCFAAGRKGMLAPVNRNGEVYYVCPGCKNSIHTGFRGIGAPSYAEEYLEPKAGKRG